MANKGRLYPRLFERDFMWRNPSPLIIAITYLPAKVKNDNLIGIPIVTGYSFPSGAYHSRLGVADYDARRVRWELIMRAGTTPGLIMYADWILDLTADWCLRRTSWEIGGVPAAYCEQNGPPSSNAGWSTFGPVTYQNGFTGPYTGTGYAWAFEPW